MFVRIADTKFSTVMERDNNFNLIRLFAALQVVYTHATIWMEAPRLPEAFGFVLPMTAGVPIFFIVSGFLISGSLLDADKGPVHYFASRALRIYPALWVNLLVLSVALGLAGGLLYGPLQWQFWQWLGAATILGSDGNATLLLKWINYQHNEIYRGFPSGVLWTLSIELGFYLVAPIIFNRWLQARHLLWLSMGVAGAVSIYFYAQSTDPEVWPYYPPTYLWFFVLGALPRIYWDRLGRVFEGKFLLWLAAYAAFGYAAFRFGEVYQYQLFRPSSLVFTFLLVGCVLSAAYSSRRLTRQLLGEVDISYGVYLWHMPIFWTLRGLGFGGLWWAAPAGAALAIAIAWLSWVAIEKPALSLKRRFGKARAARAVERHSSGEAVDVSSP